MVKGFCLAIVVAAALSLGAVVVDDKLPAGCLKTAEVEGSVVHLHRDYRDSPNGWFYWKFRVAGAAGKKLTFDFPDVKWAVGSRGAAVSLDRGRSWRWSSESEHLPTDSFDWTFAADADEVWFSQTIPYLPEDWDAFLAAHPAERDKVFSAGELCKSKKGRSVPLVRFGKLDGSAKYRMFVSARHHCQEASASPVVEGMAASFFGADELGRWLRENVELRVVPFVDYDGVVDGDQGKGRRPHDHCRDYNEDRPQVHPEVAAIMKMLKAWRPTVVQDTHSPWLRSGGGPEDTNGFAYQVGNAANSADIREFGEILERGQASGFGYRAADNVEYGKFWNKGSNFRQGQTLNAWAQLDLKTCRFVTTFEIPFADQHGKTLYPSDERGFGHDLMLAYRCYLTAEPKARVAGSDGGIWADDRGVHINAHGGCVLAHGGRYWWYGEHKTEGEAGNRAHGVAVHVYSSADLAQWTDEGAALVCSEDPNADLTDGAVVERPKVLFCAKTGKFVMRFHLELRQFSEAYGAARTGVAVADRPQGPFRYLYGARLNAGVWPQDVAPSRRTFETVSRLKEDGKPVFGLSGGPNERTKAMDAFARDFAGGQMTRDQTLFVDDDGTAYQVSASEDNSTLQIAELTSDYLGCTGRYWRMAERDWTEAPTVFKRNGWYYLIGSGCTGWAPNAARCYRARKITGPWERLGNPCRGVNPVNGLGPERTWGGQSAFVLKVQDEDRYVAMFDLWRPANAIDGRYVWRQIEFEDDRPVIRWDRAL